jgi:membrane protein YdbS with pleckstrin-like domain
MQSLLKFIILCHSLSILWRYDKNILIGFINFVLFCIILYYFLLLKKLLKNKNVVLYIFFKILRIFVIPKWCYSRSGLKKFSNNGCFGNSH